MVLGLFNKPKTDLANIAPTNSSATQTIKESDKDPLNINSVKNPSAKLDLNNLHQAPSKEPEFKGDPEDEVIVFDLDETLIAGDKQPINDAYEEKINAMGDRKVNVIPKEKSGLPFDIKYVLRPGAEELLKQSYEEGHKNIASSRNYNQYAEAICKYDPVLSKYIVGSIGREDLLSDLNKDFVKNPNHPDNYGFFKKIGCFFYTYFWYAPKFCFKKFFSLFTGANIRWNPNCGILGKHPPIMIQMLQARGNNKLSKCKPARTLVDNLYAKELGDCKRSGDFVAINPNVKRNGGDIETEFHNPDDFEPKDENGEYIWVKQVMTAIRKGWRANYKEATSKEPKA